MPFIFFRKISRRKQIILAVSLPILIVGLGVGISQVFNPYAGQIENPERIISPQKTDEELKKPEKTKAIENPENEKKDNPKPEIKTPEVIIKTPIDSPKINSEPKKPLNNFADSRLEGLKAKALGRLTQAINKSITEAKQKIASFRQEITEINRIYDKHFDDPFYNPNRVSKLDWENFRIQKLRTFIGSNAPEYQLERTLSDLKLLEDLKKTKKSFTEQEIKMLLQGMMPSLDSPYVWGYEKESDNPTLNRLKAANKRRVLNIPSWYSRSPAGIADLSYEGWNRNDVSQEFKEIDGSIGDSIKIYNYTPNAKNEDFANKKPLKVIVLDANDNQAFAKFSEILQKTTEKDQKIQAVVLKNVGDKNTNQNVSKILGAIPPSIKKLTLFLDNYNATAHLRPLENLRLDELELYSNINSLSDSWAINPNALKNIDYISFDYNNPATFHKNYPGEKIPGSIVFNTLSWDEKDTIETVNQGFSIVFDSKINQRIFQGSSGGKGGWPVNLDFSRAKNIKSLKGINFEKHDQTFNNHLKNWKDDPYAQENYRGFRTLKFKKLIFGLDSNNNFIANWDDFNGGQLNSRLTFNEPGGAQIEFRNESGAPSANPISIYLAGTPKGDAISEISAFIRAANSRSRLVSRIFVENQAVLNQIGNNIGSVQVLIGQKSQGNETNQGFLGDV